MARYHTGARAEYRLKHELEKKGWHVIRAAGSHGKWDLIAMRKRKGRLDILLIQVKRKRPPKNPIVSFYRNCSAIDCFVFFAPRKGLFLSKDWRFSVSDLSSIVHRLLGEQQSVSCPQQREHTKLCRRDCHNGSTHTRRRRACSRSTESSDHQELQRGRSDGSDQMQQGQ
jgi:Holliday junction resolvase